jgi:hypothetical protein
VTNAKKIWRDNVLNVKIPHATIFSRSYDEKTPIGMLDPGICAKRDSLPSIAYSEELSSATISATLQSTDRHHGIVVQKRLHFQLDL